MNVINKLILSAICISLALIQISCSKSESVSKQEVELRKLSSTWKATSVTLDGVAESGYENFQVTFSGATSASLFVYGITGRPAISPWPSGGTWKFTSDFQIDRDPSTADDLKMSYTVKDTQLVLNYSYTGAGYSTGRVSTAAGSWVFTFSKVN
jgi:hypothetical protein